MSDPAANLTELQARAVARLSADTFPVSFNGKDVPVLSEAKGDLATAIATHLKGLGIVCIVLTATAKRIANGDPRSNATLVYDVPLIVQVQENVEINQGRGGTHIHALTAVAAINRRLNLWSHGLNPGHDKFNKVWVDETPFEMIEDGPPLVYNANQRTEVRL